VNRQIRNIPGTVDRGGQSMAENIPVDR